MDTRIQKLAQILVHYSVKVKKGQLVKIQGEKPGLPLMIAIYEEVIKAQAYPYMQVRVPQCEEILYKQGKKHQLEFINPIAKAEINKIDCLFNVWASDNTRYLAGVDPKQIAMQRAAYKPLMQRYFKRIGDGEISWVGTQYPTPADAQEADMSLTEYENFVYSAGHVEDRDPVKHWKSVEKEQMRIVKILNRTNHLHIQAPGTDLKMRVKGRKWISCHGTENFPDGEIFTSPIEDTAEGVINFSYPAIYVGRRVENVRLEFKKGLVVTESADKDQDYLTALLNTDKQARRVGEIAIGTNYNITRHTGNILFDEKIGGTCHLAVGASIPEAGGVNKSSIHWDMVCNLKKDSEIKADGKVIYRNGKFTI
ncbi:MAG: aminopeptidase [Candidatus Zixiibacteriota bacterium]